jgi:hypothetical protein
MKNLFNLKSPLSLLSLLSLFALPAWGREVPHLLANLNREVSQSSVEGEPAGFFELRGRLLFTTSELISLSQAILWSTDGTAAGTVKISDDALT